MPPAKISTLCVWLWHISKVSTTVPGNLLFPHRPLNRYKGQCHALWHRKTTKHGTPLWRFRGLWFSYTGHMATLEAGSFSTAVHATSRWHFKKMPLKGKTNAQELSKKATKVGCCVFFLENKRMLQKKIPQQKTNTPHDSFQMLVFIFWHFGEGRSWSNPEMPVGPGKNILDYRDGVISREGAMWARVGITSSCQNFSSFPPLNQAISWHLGRQF